MNKHLSRPSPWTLAATSLAALLLVGSAWAAPAAPPAKAAQALVPPKLTNYVRAEYPEAVRARSLSGVVVLELEIDATGKVAAASVIDSAGPEFDASSLKAGRALVFEPATLAGRPVPVRIRFRYRFQAPAPVPIARPATPVAAPAPEPPPPPQGTSVLSGRLLERGTGEPVVGALVTLPKRVTDTTSDGEGRFRFEGLRAGRVEVYVPGAEHKPVRRMVRLRKDKETTLVLRPERNSYVLYRSVATAPPAPAEVARRSLSTDEIAKVPGVYGDAFKVVLNLPGVSRPAGGSGQIIVRGSAPQDSQAVVDGVQIPQLYHFGGLYSVFNTDLLEGIDFSPSGYAVRYGRRTGGLIESRLRIPRQDERWRGYVETNVFHTGFYLSGPLAEDTHIALAGRRSYIDVLLATVVPDDLLPLTLAPRYYDMQLKLDHRFGPRTTATLFLFGSDDKLTAVVDEPPAAFPDARGDVQTRITFGGALATLRHESADVRSTTTVALTPSALNLSVGSALSFDLTAMDLTLRQDLVFGRGPVQLRTGMDWLWTPYSIKLRLPPSTSTGETGTGGGQISVPAEAAAQEGSFYAPGAWVDAVFRLVPDLEVVAGLRLDFYRMYQQLDGEREKTRIDQTVSPRLNARYKVSESLSLKAATGMSSQQPEPQQLGNPPFGSPDLGAIRGFETTAGFELRLSEAIDLDLQGFHKRLWDLVVAGQPGPGGSIYANDGTGAVTGMELLLRHRPVGPFFGWVSYTLQRATRKDGPDQPERLFGWDQTHMLTALGSYKLPGNWEVGARWRLVTGSPYTPAIGAAWNADNDTWQKVQSPDANSERLPAFHQLDLRVDKKWIFDSWILGAYLDLQNAYNRANPESVSYSYDAADKTYSTGLPIIPSFGVRGEF